ncbi:MAG: glycosyl transferase family 2 [Bacteroidota bacterium]|jgi:glycosyltransferase involved in cell wall biosynthesis|nr:glycosyl transferase family 2 [Bacteroidota bacterium]
MSNVVKVAVIIPCFNEEQNVLKLYHEIKSIVLTSDIQLCPIFINDCSTDKTIDVLISNNIPYINLPVNLGIGGAVQTGYKYACRNGFDVAVQMDGDGQHPPCQLEKILSPILQGKCDVSIGSRYITREGFQSSLARRVGINYFKWLNNLLVSVIVHDSTSGYRALNAKALEVVAHYYPDEYPEPEAIILYSLNGLKISEVPVVMRERENGQSSIRSYKTVYYMFKVSLGILFLFIRLKFNGKRNTL